MDSDCNVLEYIVFQVFVFGGRIGNTRNNDLHCLDLDKMWWSGKWDLNFNYFFHLFFVKSA